MANTQYKEPREGDLIEFFRGMYQHWAVYVGHGYVVHVTENSDFPGASSFSVGSVLTDRAVVKKEKLKDVAGNDKWQINNILDEKYQPLPADKIVMKACSLVGTVQPYSVLGRNCEHFATDLRYGKPESRQAQDAVDTAKVAAVGVGVLAAVGVGALLVNALLSGGRKKKKKNSNNY